MSKDMYRTFDDCELDYGYQVNEEIETSNWSDNGSPVLGKRNPTYIMDYEDTTKLPFRISWEYATDYLMEIKVYNFRFEPILTQEEQVEDEYVYLTINSETSKELFRRGIYYIGIKAIKTVPGADEVCTLINPADCILYVR